MINIDIKGQLLPDPITMIAQLLSILVLFLIVKKYLWASIQNWLNKRAEKMQADMAASEKAKLDAQLDREKASTQLAAASQRSQSIVDAAVKQAKDEKETIIAQAKKQADAEVQKGKESVAAEREQMYKQMHDDIVNTAMDAAAALIGSQNSEDLDKQAVDAFVKEASGNGRE